MLKTSCVQRPANDVFIVIRASYVAICGGNSVAAALVHYFEQWHNHKLAAVENHIDMRTPDQHRQQAPYLPSLWQYHSSKELQDALLGLGKRHAIDEAKKLLQALGIVSIGRNPNPYMTLDNTTYFLFHPDVVNTLLTSASALAEISKGGRRKTAGPPAEISKTPYIDPFIETGQRKPEGAAEPVKEVRASEHEGVVWPWETETFWEAWVTWREFKRKQHKFVYKVKSSEQAALNELRELSNDSEAIAHAIIRQSLAHGWKGFHELKTHTNGTNETGRATSASAHSTKPGTSQARTDAIAAWGSRPAGGGPADQAARPGEQG